MSNYCPNCGNKIDDGELFCPECGSKIVEKNNASKKAIIDEEDKISKKIKERSEGSVRFVTDFSNILS